MYILMTGGAGYIGSHTCIALIEEGYKIIIFDNFSNSSMQSIKNIEKIVGQKIVSIEGNICDTKALESLFQTYKIVTVMHFAGLKSVDESVRNPLKYYDNNIYGTTVLCKVMETYKCRSMIFSSSATVYGVSGSSPIKENALLNPKNPYGHTKLFIETMLKDLYLSDTMWKIIILRYFNPIGVHESGLIGEYVEGLPNNLMPYICQTVKGERDILKVFGDDYDTHDGTGVRDYVHVMDVAEGHVSALKKLDTIDDVMTVNLGTGIGYSVLDVLRVFEKVSLKKVPYKVVGRREGDIGTYYADVSYAKEVLGWESKRDMDDMCKDVWRWIQSDGDNT